MDVVIIGAGIAGLATALRLAHAGRDVDVFETHADVGGKIRTLPTEAGPVDAGPTVLTMRRVFDELFADVGESLGDHLTLLRQDKLARHFWADGQMLDLYESKERNIAEITQVFGSHSGREYERFHNRTKLLFDSFEAPMMRAPEPSRAGMASVVLRKPSILSAMAPHRTMAQSLAREFSEPKLAQLFGRYATYVGGSPYRAPSLLSLIWQAEAGGVWQAQGGMHTLPQALKSLAEKRGARFHMNTRVAEIAAKDGIVSEVELENGQRHHANTIVFNGDPAALTTGLMGDSVTQATAANPTTPRSYSANVWSFAATPSRDDLELHNVFFGRTPNQEFTDLEQGQMPSDPTVYVHAQDRGARTSRAGAERFEIILNAPPTSSPTTDQGDIDRCRTITFSTLKTMGLSFSPAPGDTLTPPAMFNHLFPASNGALYGRSPHGLMTAFKRPTARTKIKGLYLAGGGCHPGAGVPMATLSGMHAAEAILSDQTSPLMSRRTATHGGMSTGSATMAAKPSPSSAS
jgi:1-hydroxycarotenoid 3,4-desaturase